MNFVINIIFYGKAEVEHEYSEAGIKENIQEYYYFKSKRCIVNNAFIHGHIQGYIQGHTFYKLCILYISTSLCYVIMFSLNT